MGLSVRAFFFLSLSNLLSSVVAELTKDINFGRAYLKSTEVKIFFIGADESYLSYDISFLL
jgi:hypothetical protein